MFKSVISGLIAVSVLATPMAAEARGRGDHRVERSHHGHRGVNTGEAIAIGLGALILGAAIGSDRDERYEERYEDRSYDRPVYRGRDSYYRPDRNCYSTVVTEYDYYGNRYIRREVRCF
jgi:Ni/Co efflux regulator RcnB